MVAAVERQIWRKQAGRQETRTFHSDLAQQRNDVRPVVPLANPIDQYPHLYAAPVGAARACTNCLPIGSVWKIYVASHTEVRASSIARSMLGEGHLAVVEWLELVTARERPPSQRSRDSGEIRAARHAVVHRSGPGELTPGGAGARPPDPIDAEKPVQQRPSERNEPRYAHPAQGAARIGLGEQGVQRRSDRDGDIRESEQERCERVREVKPRETTRVLQNRRRLELIQMVRR